MLILFTTSGPRDPPRKLSWNKPWDLNRLWLRRGGDGSKQRKEAFATLKNKYIMSSV
jgi:hypothetical protein